MVADSDERRCDFEPEVRQVWLELRIRKVECVLTPDSDVRPELRSESFDRCFQQAAVARVPDVDAVKDEYRRGGTSSASGAASERNASALC
jgi:hypothetical protein